jgi:hypothetical protein
VLGVAALEAGVLEAGVLDPGVDEGDGDAVSGGVLGLCPELLLCGPRTHTITTVNTMRPPDARPAMTTSRRLRGALYGVRRGGLIVS